MKCKTTNNTYFTLSDFGTFSPYKKTLFNEIIPHADILFSNFQRKDIDNIIAVHYVKKRCV